MHMHNTHHAHPRPHNTARCLAQQTNTLRRCSTACQGTRHRAPIQPRTLRNTQFAIRNTHTLYHTLYSIHYTLYTLQYTLHTTDYTLHYTLYTIHTLSHTHTHAHAAPAAQTATPLRGSEGTGRAGGRDTRHTFRRVTGETQGGADSAGDTPARDSCHACAVVCGCAQCIRIV